VSENAELEICVIWGMCVSKINGATGKNDSRCVRVHETDDCDTRTPGALATRHAVTG